MDEKDFVSYETAKKLKAAGYSEKCSSVWHFDGDSGKAKFIENYPATFHGEPNDFNNSDMFDLYVYSAPMLWQAAKWLREEKRLYILVDFSYVGTWFYKVFPIVGCCISRCLFSYPTYEEALSAGIDAALELITNKTE